MLMRSFREMCFSRALIVSGLSKTIPVDPNQRGLKLVLGWLVHLAMDNGAVALRLGVSPDTNQSWMKFLGPKWYREPKWWDMVPPEPYCFPTLLQVCFSLADIDKELPIRGFITGLRRGKRIRLALAVPDITLFEISWDQALAMDRNQAGTSYPEEEANGKTVTAANGPGQASPAK